MPKFWATSDGVFVKPPKFFKSLQGRLLAKRGEAQLLQRRVNRKQRRSKTYEKQRLKVARLHHQIHNKRKDFHYKQAHELGDAGDMIFMEDLDYRTSAKEMFGKQMLDGAFSQFRTIVKYVCWKRGKFFDVVDASWTSQECPECGGEVKKDMSVRIYNCPHCGYTTNRDVAAAQNIRNRGIKLISTVGQTGRETACAVELPGTDESQSRQVAKSRQRVTRKPKK